MGSFPCKTILSPPAVVKKAENNDSMVDSQVSLDNILCDNNRDLSEIVKRAYLNFFVNAHNKELIATIL